MAYPKDYVHSDVENLNLEPFPQMFYETFIDEDGTIRIRYASRYYQIKVYVKHEPPE